MAFLILSILFAFIKKLKCILDGETVSIVGVLTFLVCSEEHVLRNWTKNSWVFMGVLISRIWIIITQVHLVMLVMRASSSNRVWTYVYFNLEQTMMADFKTLNGSKCMASFDIIFIPSISVPLLLWVLNMALK